jgi:hypothetical protein
MKQLICKIFGHKPSKFLPVNSSGGLLQGYCKRCNAKLYYGGGKFYIFDDNGDEITKWNSEIWKLQKK